MAEVAAEAEVEAEAETRLGLLLVLSGLRSGMSFQPRPWSAVPWAWECVGNREVLT